MVDEQASHEFDVALSYAGEDRGYVAAVANGLREAGVRVFYDEFMVADLWGVDLYGYLDEVYRKRARFTIVFISHNYAAKAWTSHERQSAQARAMNEAGPYLLPVRMDDVELPGLRHTVSCIDARQTVPDQLVEFFRKKVGLAADKRKTRNDDAELVRSLGVPGTPEQRQRLLSERPIAWEYILWASVMWEGKERLEGKWRDHELRLPRPSSAVLNADNLRKFADEVLDYLKDFTRRLGVVFSDDSQQWALGKSGEPGDPVKIDHYARRVVSLYEDLIDWAAQLRGIKARPEYARLAEIAAQFVDLPLQLMRSFFDDFVREISALPARIAAGEHVDFHLTLKIDLDDSVTDAFLREYERVM
jgi:hypothetical protein